MVLDLVMPRMNGAEAASILSQTKTSCWALLAAQIFHPQLLQILGFFYLVDLGEKRFFGFGNRSHIPPDVPWSFISHFIPPKQHTRRFPDPSMAQAFSIRRLRVSGCLAELIHRIQSRRAMIAAIAASRRFIVAT